MIGSVAEFDLKEIRDVLFEILPRAEERDDIIEGIIEILLSDPQFKDAADYFYDLLSDERKSDPAFEERYNEYIIWFYARSGDVERILKSLERIRDETARNSIISNVALILADAGKYDDALKISQKMSDPMMRDLTILKIFQNAKNHPGIREMLDEIGKHLEERMTSFKEMGCSSGKTVDIMDEIYDCGLPLIRMGDEIVKEYHRIGDEGRAKSMVKIVIDFLDHLLEMIEIREEKHSLWHLSFQNPPFHSGFSSGNIFLNDVSRYILSVKAGMLYYLGRVDEAISILKSKPLQTFYAWNSDDYSSFPFGYWLTEKCPEVERMIDKRAYPHYLAGIIRNRYLHGLSPDTSLVEELKNLYIASCKARDVLLLEELLNLMLDCGCKDAATEILKIAEIDREDGNKRIDLVSLVNIYISIGKLDSAKRVLDEEYEKVIGGGSSQSASIWNIGNLVKLYHRVGDYGRSTELLNSLINLARCMRECNSFLVINMADKFGIASTVMDAMITIWIENKKKYLSPQQIPHYDRGTHTRDKRDQGRGAQGKGEEGMGVRD